MVRLFIYEHYDFYWSWFFECGAKYFIKFHLYTTLNRSHHSCALASDNCNVRICVWCNDGGTDYFCYNHSDIKIKINKRTLINPLIRYTLLSMMEFYSISSASCVKLHICAPFRKQPTKRSEVNITLERQLWCPGLADSL